MAFIVPDPAPTPLYGDELEDVFHDTIAGILSLDGSLVRPRWQANPPNQPDFDVDWVAFGIVNNKGDWNPYMGFDATADLGNGADVFERDEELILLHSYYGPNSMKLQSLFQDGLYLDDNRALLTAQGIKFISFVDAMQVPALMKETWVKKMDQRYIFRRRIRRQYPIRYLLSATATLDNEQYLTQITVTTPP